MTIAETRRLLGALGEGRTDDEVERLHDELAGAANAMFDHLKGRLRGEPEAVVMSGDELPGFPSRTEEQRRRDDLEHIRWTAYLHENTDDKDAL